MTTGFENYQSLDVTTKPGDNAPLRSIPTRLQEYALSYTKETRMLDIGCNRGYFGIELSPRITTYTGIDLDEVQLRFGREEATKRGYTNCKFVQTDFATMQVVPSSYDLILMCAVHSYINLSMTDLADKLVQLLKPGGFLYIESHPPTYRGEPEAYWDPLMAALEYPRFLKLLQQEVVDRKNRRQFVTLIKPTPETEFQVGPEGMAATVYTVPGYHYVAKRYKAFDYDKVNRNIGGHWIGSIHALRLLQYYSFVPRLYHIDNDEHVIYMEYCGEGLTRENLPQDWQTQASLIDRGIKACRICHNDVMIKNILVKEGKLYLVDWGLTTSYYATPRNGVFTCIKAFLEGKPA